MLKFVLYISDIELVEFLYISIEAWLKITVAN